MPFVPQPTNKSPLPPRQRSNRVHLNDSGFLVVTQYPDFQAPPVPADNPQQTAPQPTPDQSAFNINGPGPTNKSPLPPRQRSVHLNNSGFLVVTQYPDFQAPPVPADTPQQIAPQPTRRPPPDQSAFNINGPGDYAFQWHGQQPQSQQQKRLHHPLSQDPLPAKRQRSDGPNVNRQAQHHGPLPSQPQVKSPPFPAHMDSGSQFGSAIRAYGSGGCFDGATSMQAESRDSILNSAEPAGAPMAAQFQGAHHVNISGNPTMMNIGTNTGFLTTVNNYGGYHSLEKLEKIVSFAALHNSAEQDPERLCYPGTRKTVLRRLRDWFDAPNPTDRIFWLYGPAGAGKSAIAQTIADECKEGVAATFFFYRSDPIRNDGNRLFPTLVWQLAFSIPAIKDHIVHAFDKAPHLPTQRVEIQFEQLVAHPFQAMSNIASQVSQLAPVVIIDGLDECSDEQLQRRILTIIGNAVKDRRVPLRFLICSRPEALIEETLDQFKDFTLRIDLATLNDSNRDIEEYLVGQFSNIASKRGLNPTWPGQETIQEIVFKSSGNFILASTLIRHIGDEDYSAQSQLDIIRNLKPPGSMSPFALLDELYLEILKQQRDQDFLKTFLALLVGYSSIEQDDLHKDDATLMNVSEEELHIKLRKMRSLIKFKPFIDIYHKSFLDFLQDSSRSGQYHISKQDGQKRYLELIVRSVVRHVSMVIDQPDCHGKCSSPTFEYVVRNYPPKIVLSIEDWQEALKPLLDLQDKLLKTLRPQPCHITQVMRDLLLHLVILQRNSDHITAAQAPQSDMNEAVTGLSPALMTVAQQNIPEKDLDSCLSALLSCLQVTEPVMVVDRTMIAHISSLLTFDYAETAARIRSVLDAQKLIDIIDLLTNDESFLSQCGPDAAHKAAYLASAIFARVPVLPRSLFLNGPTYHRYWRPTSRFSDIEVMCQSTFISRILDHNYVVPLLWQEDSWCYFVGVHVNVRNESVDAWLQRSRPPDLGARIRVMIEIARIIRYIHSMDVTLDSRFIRSDSFALDSNFRAKFLFNGLFVWWVREALIDGYDYSGLLTNNTRDSNISAFADLFHSVCFKGRKKIVSNRLAEDARQLIERCRAKDPKSRPTMEDVVTEMKTWNLT